MTSDEIIRMAREAGLMVETSDEWDVWQPDNLESFASLVAAAEREECAKVCDDLVLAHPGRADLTAQQCAFAIRERGAP